MARPKKTAKKESQATPIEVETPRRTLPTNKVVKQFQRDRQFEHHLFKLKVAEFMKNVSWVFNEPRLIPMEHGHFFHSINARNGQPNIHCVPTAGHFHLVEIEWDDATGELVSAKCGPALQIKKRMKGKRLLTNIVPVKFSKDIDLPPQGVANLVDNHTHDVLYLHSTVINLHERAEKVKQTQKEVSGLVNTAQLKDMAVARPEVPKDITMAPAGPRE